MDANLHLIVFTVFLVACDCLCNFEKFEYYSQARRRCSKCDKCIQGEGTIEVDIQFSIEYGALTCRPCRPCPDGFYNKRRAYKCRKCKDCEARGKYTLTSCSRTENAKCGGRITTHISTTLPSVSDVEYFITSVEDTTASTHVLKENGGRFTVHVAEIIVPIICGYLILAITCVIYKFRVQVLSAVRNVFNTQRFSGIVRSLQEGNASSSTERNPAGRTFNQYGYSSSYISQTSSLSSLASPTIESKERQTNACENDIEVDAELYNTSTLQSLNEDISMQPLIQRLPVTTHDKGSFTNYDRANRVETKTKSLMDGTSDGRSQNAEELKRTILNASKHLAPRRYIHLCRNLGVSDADLNTIEYNYRDDGQEQAYQSLKKWTEISPKASVHHLRECIIKAGYKDILDKL